MPSGMNYLTPQPLSFQVTFPEICETVEVNIYSPVFGLRLYKKIGQQAAYLKVDSLDYYSLETSALYIHTKSKSMVAIYVNGSKARVAQANEEGDILVEDLCWLKRHCQKEQTEVSIICEGQKNTFFVYWKPLIYDIFIQKNSVYLKVSGPMNTGIVLTLLERDGYIHSQTRIACGGDEISTTIELPSIQWSWKQCYLVPQYFMADGTLLPTAWQQRLEGAETVGIPIDWLRMGIGIQSEMLPLICKNKNELN